MITESEKIIESTIKMQQLENRFKRRIEKGHTFAALNVSLIDKGYLSIRTKDSRLIKLDLNPAQQMGMRENWGNL